MTWLFRVVELEEGTWACRRGRTTVDEHDALDEALTHTCALAAEDRPSQVRVHHLDQPPTIAATFTEPTEP